MWQCIKCDERNDASFNTCWKCGYTNPDVPVPAMHPHYVATPDVKEYIHHQKEHHRKRDFREELLAMLRLHEVEFDRISLSMRGQYFHSVLSSIGASSEKGRIFRSKSSALDSGLRWRG